MEGERTAAAEATKLPSPKGLGLMGRSAKIFTRRSLYVDSQGGGSVTSAIAASGGGYRTRAATVKSPTSADGADGVKSTTEEDSNNPLPVFMPADHRLKVLVVGDGGTGKTTLVNTLSLPPHLSSPLQRLSSFLGNKSGTRDKQLDRSGGGQTAQLSQFDSDEILDITQWHSEGRKMADRESQQQGENSRKGSSKKKTKRKSRRRTTNGVSELQPKAEQQKNESEELSLQETADGGGEEKAKKDKKDKKKKREKKEKQADDDGNETEEQRLRRKRKEKRRSKSMLNLEAFAAEAAEAKKPPSYGVNADLGLKIYNLPIKGQHSFMVSAYDFSRNRLDVCPFFVHERGVILLVYNLETELAQPTIEKWLKLIRQVTHSQTASPAGDLNLKRLPRAPTFNTPRVIVVGRLMALRERSRTFQDARKCTRDHLVAVQERVMSLSKRFPNIVGSHTVSNTTRKGIPALQEALETEVVAYGHSVGDWFKHMPVGVLALHDKLRQIRKFGYPKQTEEADTAGRQRSDTIVREKGCKPVPVISFSDLEKIGLGYGMNHHQIQACLSFWNDVGIISYINDSQQRGWYHRGKSTSLSSWVFLDRNWPAHLYLRLCQNAREFLPKRGMLICPERGMALCSHLSSVWPKAMCKEARREIVLMYLEKIEMMFYLRPKRMKVLILEDDDDNDANPLAQSVGAPPREGQPSTSAEKNSATTTTEPVAPQEAMTSGGEELAGAQVTAGEEDDKDGKSQVADGNSDSEEAVEENGEKPRRKLTPKTQARREVLIKSGERGRAGTASILDDMQRLRRRERQQDGETTAQPTSPKDTDASAAGDGLGKSVSIQAQESGKEKNGGEDDEEQQSEGGSKIKREKESNFIRRKMARASLLLRSNDITKELAKMEKSEKKNEDDEQQQKNDDEQVEEEGYGQSMNLSEGGLIMLTYSSKTVTRGSDKLDGTAGDARPNALSGSEETGTARVAVTGKQKALLKTKREHFKTVYRNMSSIERELNLKASGLSEGIDSTIPNMLQVGGAADPRLFLPQALPAKVDDFDRKSSPAEILANAGWNPPKVEGDALKPRKVVIDAPTTVQKRIFSFDSPTSLPSSLLARLVVRFLEVGCKLPLVWRQGMLVIKDDCLALIEGNCPEQDQVTISVYGKQHTAKFISLLEFNINDAATHWYGLTPTVYIPCVHCLRRGTQPPHLFSLHECEEAVVHGRTWLSCPREARESQGIKVLLNQLVPDLALAGLERFQIEHLEIQILGDIARGSVSLVKKGLYKGQEVAVKEFVLPDSHDYFSRAEYLKVLQEFRSEVSLLSGLDHENIVRLVGFCKTPLSLVMEYLPEGDLLHYLRERKKSEVDLSTKMTIALDIAKGMYFLHSTSPPIIHRDLKSANILLKNNRAKVTDFGLSTVYSLTTQGRDVDNPLWLAPEVMRGEEASEKADCYSFGVILWEIASHETPYSEYDYSFVTHLEDRIMKEQLRPTIPNDTPWQLANLIRSCWKDSPSERPSFFQIVRRLKQMLVEFEEDEAEKRRLRVEYERELNIAGSSMPLGGGGGVGKSMLGKSIRKIGRGLGELRDDLGVGSSADLSPRAGGSHEGEELVLKVNPLMRIRKMTLANITDDLNATTTTTTATTTTTTGTPLRASSKAGGHRRKLSIGSALGQSEKEKDSVVRSSGKP